MHQNKNPSKVKSLRVQNTFIAFSMVISKVMEAFFNLELKAFLSLAKIRFLLNKGLVNELQNGKVKLYHKVIFLVFPRLSKTLDKISIFQMKEGLFQTKKTMSVFF